MQDHVARYAKFLLTTLLALTIGIGCEQPASEVATEPAPHAPAWNLTADQFVPLPTAADTRSIAPAERAAAFYFNGDDHVMVVFDFLDETVTEVAPAPHNVADGIASISSVIGLRPAALPDGLREAVEASDAAAGRLIPVVDPTRLPEIRSVRTTGEFGSLTAGLTFSSSKSSSSPTKASSKLVDCQPVLANTQVEVVPSSGVAKLQVALSAEVSGQANAEGIKGGSEPIDAGQAQPGIGNDEPLICEDVFGCYYCEVYLDCTDDCDDDWGDCKSQCQAAYDAAIDAANDIYHDCYQLCDDGYDDDGYCGPIGQFFCERACDVALTAAKAAALSARTGCYAGCDLGKTACYSGCRIGSSVDCPPDDGAVE